MNRSQQLGEKIVDQKGPRRKVRREDVGSDASGPLPLMNIR